MNQLLCLLKLETDLDREIYARIHIIIIIIIMKVNNNIIHNKHLRTQYLYHLCEYFESNHQRRTHNNNNKELQQLIINLLES